MMIMIMMMMMMIIYLNESVLLRSNTHGIHTMLDQRIFPVSHLREWHSYCMSGPDHIRKT